MKNIYIIGAGGHAKVVADIILKHIENLKEEIRIAGFLDDGYSFEENREIFGIKIIGKIDYVLELSQDINNYFVIAIGSNLIREKITLKYNLNYYTAIHPDSIIGNNVDIGIGSVVMAGTIINSYSKIGKHCIINSGAIIEHDNVIEDFVHIAPKSAIAGGVKIGKGSWIGIGSSIIQNIEIGAEAFIGAGSVVVKNIGTKVKAYGNPCREVERV